MPEEELGSVEPVTLYEAWCGLDMPAQPDKNLLEGQCEWSWVCDRYGSDADCEVELTVHMKFEHGLDRPLPHGYEYMQERLDARLREEAGQVPAA